VFAALTTACILIAIQLEERDLVDAHPEHQGYRRRAVSLSPSARHILTVQIQFHEHMTTEIWFAPRITTCVFALLLEY
jgi:hypothetical protein